MIVARSEFSGHSVAERLHIPLSRLAIVRSKPSGTMRVASLLIHEDMLLGYRTVPELGLVAEVLGRRDDMLAMARLRALTWRRARAIPANSSGRLAPSHRRASGRVRSSAIFGVMGTPMVARLGPWICLWMWREH